MANLSKLLFGPVTDSTGAPVPREQTEYITPEISVLRPVQQYGASIGQAKVLIQMGKTITLSLSASELDSFLAQIEVARAEARRVE